MKIYLTGLSATENFENLKEIVNNNGFEGISLNNDIITDDPSHVFTTNVNMIKQCGIIIANVEPFSINSTWDIAYAFGLGKKIWAYSENTPNLMIAECVKKSGGNIFNAFEQCIKDISKFFNIDLLKVLSADIDFVDLLIIKKLKTIIREEIDDTKVCIFKDKENQLDELLIKRYAMPEYHVSNIIRKLNLDINSGIECFPIFNTTENFRRYAMQLFELPTIAQNLSKMFTGRGIIIVETPVYKKEKERVKVILRDKQIAEILD